MCVPTIGVRMAIKIVNGDILTVETGIIMHGCNAQGVMNSGVAKQIRKKYPGAYDAYRNCYEDDVGLELGDIIWYRVPNKNLIIANAITQEFYGRDKDRVYVDYEAISYCFAAINSMFGGSDVSLNFPKIGAGLANGDWNIISHRINECAPDINKTLWVYDESKTN